MDDQKNRDGKLSRVIAAQKPWTWAAGPDEGMTPRFYHGSSRGLVLNQILARADPEGRTVGEWLMQELAEPLDCDFYCGPGGNDAKPWASLATAPMKPPAPEFVFANQVLPAIIRRGFPDKVRSVVSPCPAASCRF